jgi:hypothetical protein
MFYVIQKIFDATGQQTDSDSIAEFSVEHEANALVERLFAECGHRAPDGSYAEWHVEAE